MPRKSPYQIMLTPHERETLQSWAGKYTFRCKGESVGL
jgi:hypothetical protein